jgi:hypothetical protein
VLEKHSASKLKRDERAVTFLAGAITGPVLKFSENQGKLIARRLRKAESCKYYKRQMKIVDTLKMPNLPLKY